MPLSPARRREVREQQKRLADPPKGRHIRCRNCGKRSPVPETVKIKLFCSPGCKAEYHRHGSAFGPLKTRLENLVRKYFKEIAQDRVAALEKRVAELEAAALAVQQ